jgi:hypothetical protein
LVNKIGVGVGILFAAAVIKVTVDPPKKAAETPFVPTVMQGPAPRVDPQATAVAPAPPETAATPLTEDQQKKIADFKAMVAASIVQHAITDVDYERGILRVNAVQWDADDKAAKEGILQGLYVASFGNQPYKIARVFSDAGYEELGRYVGGTGPTISR